jgi:hypothetical protein
MPRTKNPAKPTTDEAVTTTRYEAKRRELPASGMAARREELKEGPPKIRHKYNPHLPPALRFDSTGTADALPPRFATTSRGWSGRANGKSRGLWWTRWRCTCTSG